MTISKKRRKKDSVQARLNILSAMAPQKETAQYEMSKLTTYSYRTILRNLRLLEKDGLIKLVRTEPSQKRGKERNIYALTLGGLVNAFWNNATWENDDPKSNRNLERIIEQHPDMLLSFEKWPLFRNAGEKMANYFLLQILTVIKNLYRRLDYFEIHIVFEKEEYLREVLDSTILVEPFFIRQPNPEPLEELRRGFMEICRKDLKLRRFVDEGLQKQEERLKEASRIRIKWNSL